MVGWLITLAEYIGIYRSTCTNTSTNGEVCSDTWLLFLFLDGALGDALCGDLVNIQDSRCPLYPCMIATIINLEWKNQSLEILFLIKYQ